MAILRSIEILISISNHFGIETSICIESDSNPNKARILVKYDIKAFSYNLDVILQYEKLYIKRKKKKILV